MSESVKFTPKQKTDETLSQLGYDSVITNKTKPMGGPSVMAIIPQINLFSWEEIEDLGDLDRLRLVLEYMPDEQLMQTLEMERKNGRNDYPVRAVWNTILAGIVFQHDSTESLRRELNRNGQLRWLCGLRGNQAPSSYVYS